MVFEGILSFQYREISIGIMLLQIVEIGIVGRIQIQLILTHYPKNQIAQGWSVGVVGRPQTQSAMCGDRIGFVRHGSG